MIPPLSSLLPSLMPDPVQGLASSTPFPSPMEQGTGASPHPSVPQNTEPSAPADGSLARPDAESTPQRAADPTSKDRASAESQQTTRGETAREGRDATSDRVSRGGTNRGERGDQGARAGRNLAGRLAAGPALTGHVPRAMTTSEALKLSTTIASGRSAGAIPAGGAVDGVGLAIPLADGLPARVAVDGSAHRLAAGSVAQQVADAMRTLDIGAEGDARFRLHEAKLSVTVERHGADLVVRISGDDAATRAALAGIIEDVRRALIAAQLVDGEVEVSQEQDREGGPDEPLEQSGPDDEIQEEESPPSLMTEALARAGLELHTPERSGETGEAR